jgi:hypothetical protein
MGNFVNYMDKLREAISNAGDAVQAQVLSFPAMYNPSSGDDVSLCPPSSKPDAVAVWLSLMLVRTMI